MEKLYAKEIASGVDGRLLQGDSDACATGVSTDTRTLKPGDLFFALVGDNADGHRYVSTAVEAGASGVVISDESCVPPNCPAFVVKVDDVLWALGDLAKYYRSKFDVQVIGITGSTGKTTTKDMLTSIFQQKWNVLSNRENFNNEIGVPLTLFQLDSSHEVAVIEMGMRGLEEIRRLTGIAQPSVGVITNIGISHIERLGSQGAIADAKAELLEGLPPDGTAVVNVEDGYYMVMRQRFDGRYITFGSCRTADVFGADMESVNQGHCRFALRFDRKSIKVRMPVLGQHNAYNALAAAAAAIAVGVDLETIRDGLESFSPSSMRMELFKTKSGYAVLNDAYNANPASMLAAIRTLMLLSNHKRKIVVLGDMLELGNYATKAHRDIGSVVAGNDIEMLVTVGALGKLIADGAIDAGYSADAVLCYTDSMSAIADIPNLKKHFAKGDAILVKGSRGLKMEEIVRALSE